MSLPMGMFSKAAKKSEETSVSGSDASDQTAADAEAVSDFPQQQQFWRGGDYQLLGSGIRYFKIGFVSLKVSLAN